MNIIFPYDENKLRSRLKMAVQRIKIHVNKKEVEIKMLKREVATLLGEDKEEKARIRVERIVKEDFTMESYLLLELWCDQVYERSKYMSSMTECPVDMKEALCSIIWGGKRVDIEEFTEIKNQISKKFGSNFIKQAESDDCPSVNIRLREKLKYDPPSALLINNYLCEIAKEFNVDWTPTVNGVNRLNEPMPSAQGYSVQMAPGSGLPSAYQRLAPPELPRNPPPVNNAPQNNNIVAPTGPNFVIPNSSVDTTTGPQDPPTSHAADDSMSALEARLKALREDQSNNN